MDRWRARVVYRVVCLICGKGYMGTTGGSLHKRVREHMGALRRGDCGNAVGKHFPNEYAGVDTEEVVAPLFVVEILRGRASSMERYIEEGVTEGKGAEMNSKGEWGRINTRRIGVLDTIGE